MNLSNVETPALVLDATVMERNIQRMRARVAALGVSFRPHVKTHKCAQAMQATLGAPTGPIIVSTLREADYFASLGVRDILYGVGLSSNKLVHVGELLRQGIELQVVLDNVAMAREVSAYAESFALDMRVLVEIDSDGHRSGIAPDSALLIEVARELRGSHVRLLGVMTHAGKSYDCRGESELRAMAAQEREAVVLAAARLRAAGFACPVVSVGSTPTATFATDLTGVTELRAGVFVFHDLVMHGLGVCTMADIAISVLTTVIGHQPQKGWIITDAGWMALSRDRGTARHEIDQGYGVVCDASGASLTDLIVVDANQEHGVIASRSGAPVTGEQFPVGTMLRVLPNHACATAAQHSQYRVVRGSAQIEATWPRLAGI